MKKFQQMQEGPHELNTYNISNAPLVGHFYYNKNQNVLTKYVIF